MRVPLESSYQDGNPLLALTGPTAVRPVPEAGSLAASAVVVRPSGTATAAATRATALRHGRRRWRDGASRLICLLMEGHSGARPGPAHCSPGWTWTASGNSQDSLSPMPGGCCPPNSGGLSVAVHG